MTPEEATVAIRAACRRRPELRYRQQPVAQDMVDWSQKNMHPMKGFCYIATQVFCHLIPEACPWSQGRNHFWAKIGDTIWDPTGDQFEDTPLEVEGVYAYGEPTRFKSLCARARALLEEVQATA